MRQEAERKASALQVPGNNPRQPPVIIAPEALVERLKAIQVETERRMIGSVLSPGQQAKLRDMRGNEFAGATRFGSVNALWASDAAISDSSKQPK